MKFLRVLSPGSFTTIQDHGRYGYLDRGVPLSGALDPFAYRIANLLVGNTADAAVLEITRLGPELEILGEGDIAVTGAEMAMTLNGSPVDGWKSLRVKRGDVLRIRQARSGCRAYLAVTGGIDVPPVMGSRSTCVRAKIGGLEGRPLQRDDILRRGEGDLIPSPRILPVDWRPVYPKEITLRAIPGPQEEVFRNGMDTFFNSVYRVSPQADRMGYRLQGPPIPHDDGYPQSIISEPTLPGNVQLPADGQPIILLVEQTTGGYTKIATVISTDLSKVAQSLPGYRVRFEKVSLEEAHALCRDQAGRMRIIEEHLSSL